MRLSTLIEELEFEHGSLAKAVDYNPEIVVEINDGILVSVDEVVTRSYTELTFKLRRSL